MRPHPHQAPRQRAPGVDALPPGSSLAMEYEFSPRQERTIAGLSTAMLVCSVGLFMIASAVLVSGLSLWLLFTLPLPLELKLTALLAILTAIGFCARLGVNLLQARAETRRVCQTQGRDITQLMAAMTSIQAYFRLLALVSIGVLLLALALNTFTIFDLS